MSLQNSTPLPPDENIAAAAVGNRTAGRSLGTLLWRAARLRCPVCGQGRLFRGWFRMYEVCECCGFRFERSPGYWLGSIFVNYGLTALIVTGAYFALYFTEALPQDWIMRLLLAFCVLFPLWFFRYARSAWIAIDMYFDPEPPAKITAASTTERKR
ncbi:MAG TPA: DUF983 domain-containing protein [Pirellulales bacterium]|jgi:uncharacterized protein (DUF983 family)|nr:DUF983 domain-containing protein [Pirellulales bacterium]